MTASASCRHCWRDLTRRASRTLRVWCGAEESAGVIAASPHIANVQTLVLGNDPRSDYDAGDLTPLLAHALDLEVLNVVARTMRLCHVNHPRLKKLSLCCPAMSADTLAAIASFPNLETLVLSTGRPEEVHAIDAGAFAAPTIKRLELRCIANVHELIAKLPAQVEHLLVELVDEEAADALLAAQLPKQVDVYRWRCKDEAKRAALERAGVVFRAVGQPPSSRRPAPVPAKPEPPPRFVVGARVSHKKLGRRHHHRAERRRQQSDHRVRRRRRKAFAGEVLKLASCLRWAACPL